MRPLHFFLTWAAGSPGELIVYNNNKKFRSFKSKEDIQDLFENEGTSVVSSL